MAPPAVCTATTSGAPALAVLVRAGSHGGAQLRSALLLALMLSRFAVPAAVAASGSRTLPAEVRSARNQ